MLQAVAAGLSSSGASCCGRLRVCAGRGGTQGHSRMHSSELHLRTGRVPALAKMRPRVPAFFDFLVNLTLPVALLPLLAVAAAQEPPQVTELEGTLLDAAQQLAHVGPAQLSRAHHAALCSEGKQHVDPQQGVGRTGSMCAEGTGQGQVLGPARERASSLWPSGFAGPIRRLPPCIPAVGSSRRL